MLNHNKIRLMLFKSLVSCLGEKALKAFRWGRMQAKASILAFLLILFVSTTLPTVSHDTGGEAKSHLGHAVETAKMFMPEVALAEKAIGHGKTEKVASQPLEEPLTTSLPEKLFNIDWSYWIVHLLRIFFIISISIFIWKILNIAIVQYFSKIKIFKMLTDDKKSETSALIKTVVPIVKSICHWALILVTTLMVLDQLGIDTKPLTVGLGFLTVALAFGSQALVKDLINGILTLFEGNVSVGDIVSIGKNSGTVESMSLRAISLRHFSGELQTIPFSEASLLTNCSRDFSYVSIPVTLTGRADLKQVQDAYTMAYRRIIKDPHYACQIKEELGTIGVKSITNTGVIVSSSITLFPDPRKKFLYEFNRILLEELQKRSIPLACMYYTGAEGADDVHSTTDVH